MASTPRERWTIIVSSSNRQERHFLAFNETFPDWADGARTRPVLDVDRGTRHGRGSPRPEETDMPSDPKVKLINMPVAQARRIFAAPYAVLV
jgi:hypothetical protein